MQWESSSEGDVVTRVAQTDMGDFVVVEAGKHIHLRTPVAPGVFAVPSLLQAFKLAQELHDSYVDRAQGVAVTGEPRFVWQTDAGLHKIFGTAVFTVLPLGAVSIVKESKASGVFKVMWPWANTPCPLEAKTLADAKREVEDGYIFFIKTEAESLQLFNQPAASAAQPTTAP